MPSNAEPTYDELFALGRAEAATKRPELRMGRGDLSEMCIAAGAAMGSAVSTYAAGRHRALTTNGSGQDLADLALDRWRITKGLATPAKGHVRLTRPAGAAPAGTILAGDTVATPRDTSGKRVELTLDAPVIFGLGDLGPHVVAVTATIPGPDGNVDKLRVTEWVSTPFDSTIAVTNPDPIAGGNPDQADDSLRQSIRDFPNALRRATIAAIAYVVGRVDGVGSVTVAEEMIGGRETGIINVFVSDAQGQGNPALVTAVQAAIPSVKAGGAMVNVWAGAMVKQPIKLQVTLAAGIAPADAAELVANIRRAVAAGVNRGSNGELLTRDKIRYYSIATDPTLVKAVTVITPPTDVQPAADTSIRISETDVEVI